MKKFNLKRGNTVLSVTLSLLKYAIAIGAICWLLTYLGVDVSAIFASLGLVALIVGFSAESLIADVVTGIFFLFENQYNVGDIVEVNGFRGTVDQIGIRTTRLKDTGNNIKIINNSQMTNILNRSDKLSSAVSDIGISYETDLRELEAQLSGMLDKIFENQKDLFQSKPNYLGVQELATSAIVLRFVAEAKEEDVFKATRALNRELLLAFVDAGIKIPYNQLEIHSN